ncbi:MAG: acylneuraminate cytidylyltransferase family protein [Gammaproteobacteria bacterium]|nr:acylneuraminate cytidylyltransferase family protein [Gammaproteobacteria bacterium]MDH5728289.1 acylneuraminate cytidylyltransferase family protein [Gammaproteobacteria bacterium]
MISGKKVLGLIPARGGSKGLPGKNLKALDGEPLLGWTIRTARQSKYIDSLILSSEDDEIISMAKQYEIDVPFKRPVELAQDDTYMHDVVTHALDNIGEEFDYVVLLYLVVPFRRAMDIDQILELCENNQAKTAVSLTAPSKSPFWMYQVNEQTHEMTPLFPEHHLVNRRQELPSAYVLNGALFVFTPEWFRQNNRISGIDSLGYIMPAEYSVDIDSPMDFAMADSLIKNGFVKKPF